MRYQQRTLGAGLLSVVAKLRSAPRKLSHAHLDVAFPIDGRFDPIIRVQRHRVRNARDKRPRLVHRSSGQRWQILEPRCQHTSWNENIAFRELLDMYKRVCLIPRTALALIDFRSSVAGRTQTKSGWAPWPGVRALGAEREARGSIRPRPARWMAASSRQ
jgi:hypothetical protein